MNWRGSEHAIYDVCAWSVSMGYLEDMRRYKAVERIRLEG
jgi:hypothetical protein